MAVEERRLEGGQFSKVQIRFEMRVHYPSRNIKKEIKDAGLEMCRKLENHSPTVNQTKWNNCTE